MAMSYPAFATWLEGARVKGDVSGVIEIPPKSDGQPTYYIVGYYEGQGYEVWKATAISSIVTAQMEEWYQGADGNGGQLAATPVEKKEKSLKGIKVSQYFVNFSYTMMYGTSAT